MGDMTDYVNSRLEISRPHATINTQAKVSCYGKSATCQQCGKPMIKKQGTYGVFWGCTSFPKCKGSRGILR